MKKMLSSNLKKLIFNSLFIFLSINSFSQQYNYNFEQYGNESTLLLGNVTAGINDLGLVYYNPARFAFNDSPSFMINARAYKFSKIKITGVEETNVGKTNTSFSAIPTMTAGTFKIKNQKFIYSFISKINFNNAFEISFPSITKDFFIDIPNEETYKGNLNITNAVNEELIGITWAKKLTENFSIGISTFVSIYRSSGSSSSNYIVNHSSDLYGFLENKIGYEQRSYGLLGKIGMSYVSPKIDLGLNITLPNLEVKRNARFSYKYFVSGIGSGIDELVQGNLSINEASRKTPLSMDLGTTIKFNKHKIHLKTSYHSSIKEYRRINLSGLEISGANYDSFLFNEKLKPIVNYGIATEMYLSKNIKSYLGFSTDFSPVKQLFKEEAFNFNTDDLNLNADFYHYSLGFNMNTHLANLFLGATYSRAQSNVNGVLTLPEITDRQENSVYKHELWRLMIGIEIPLFKEKLSKIIK